MAENLKFPIENEIDYPAWIEFTAYELPDVINQTAQKIRDQNAAAQEQTYENPQGTPKRSITLYLPQSLEYPGNVTYNNNARLGAAGAFVESQIRTGRSVLASSIDAIRESFLSTIDAISTGLDGTTASKIAVSKIIPRLPENFGNAISSAARVTDNPNFRTLFESVPIREFSFSFKMIPESKTEQKSIEDIIYHFRQELYPAAIQAEQDDQNPASGIVFGYEYPNQFEINPYYRTKEGGKVSLGHKFLRCYLTNFDVKYNTESMGFFADGKFTSYEINLTLTETRALSKKDIEEGF